MWKSVSSIFSKKNNKEALQAQVRHKTTDFLTLPLSQTDASATVEASLVLPFFLCALCTVCMIAQFLLIEASVYHATLQSARVYARQEAVKDISKTKQTSQSNQSDQSAKSSKLAELGGMLETKLIFLKYLNNKDADTAYVFGGRNGVILYTDSEDDYVKLRAEYLLRVPVPFFKYYFLKREIIIRCRKFSGYALHYGENDEGSDNDMVYVAQYGNVYHTSLSCYHLTVSITDPSEVKKIMESAHYKKCSKCIHAGNTPEQIYLTKDGDCYHSSLSCSGLKRSVKAVNKSDVSGMRMCSECAKHTQ